MFQISKTKFINNSAFSNGGALFVTKADKILVSDSSFENNIALNGCGGSLYVDKTYLYINSKNNSFENNSAFDTNGGGAIYLREIDGNLFDYDN